MQGLQEFLAACGVCQPWCGTQAQDGADDGGAGGVHQTSCNIQAQDEADDEVAGEGPFRIIFDVENISEQEKAQEQRARGSHWARAASAIKENRCFCAIWKSCFWC